jgi:hypothetical protein
MERVSYGLLLANAQMFHRFPPSPHFEGGEEREQKREIISASHASA